MRIMLYYDGVRSAWEILPAVKKHALETHALLDIVLCMDVSGTLSISELKNREVDLDYIKQALAKEHIPCVEHILITSHNEGFDLGQFLEKNDIDEIMLCTGKNNAILNAGKLKKKIKQNNISLTDLERIISGQAQG